MKKEKYPSNEKTRQILQDNLKSIREILNWTSADLGNLIGVTKQTISNLETKNSKLTKLHYIAIRTVVDFEIEQLKSTDSDRAERTCMLLEVLSKAEEENLDFDEISQASKLIVSSTSAMIAGTIISALIPFVLNGFNKKK
ncbi:helix-turn-helix transcriptional regulator [Streptococcus parasanguinis]|uniref:helix-turn-helix transcriptional regulator n=1 Tax=Streptococcus parasanguinis TaxID=1318 RepID=UPI0020C8F508|nr:helix-turn-helix transcriptional regulator [Streptococcus parasanguinis]MCP9068003.1 helix-turn-helix domain-containing protein [Streptococcus parasanguinis]